MAAGLALAPPVPPGVEVWCCNNPLRAYGTYRPQAREEYTRWFNLHSREHMLERAIVLLGMRAPAYPRGYAWYGTQTKPIYLQDVQADVPASVRFPKDELIEFYGHRYFTFSAAWEMGLAVYEGFERIELWGFRLSPRKPLYARERPCFAYWVEEARRRGVDVMVDEAVGSLDGQAGNPHEYTGPLYGYETS